MRHRPLGRTGYTVSEIGFGAWGLGATMWRGVEDAAGREALESALDLGVTFIDTAFAYGDGHSERLIAEVLRGRGGAGDVVVATKIPPRNSEWPGRKSAKLREAFPPDWIESLTARSAANLGLPAIPLQQFHVWHDAWLADPDWLAVRATMARLREQGRVLHWGVSVNDHEPWTAERLLDDPLIESVQLIYNIFDRSPERGALDRARRNGLGVIVRVPFDEGALTGGVREDTVFPEGDWRHRYFRGDRRAEAARRADALSQLLGEEARTLPELALRFCLSRSEVATVIPGMRRASHARANAAVSDGRTLSPGLLERLRSHAFEKNWYRG